LEIVMYLVGIGIILLALKYLEIGPVAAWSWVTVLLPFALAMVWWAWADTSGYTKRKAMEREDARRLARLDRHHAALGTVRNKKKPPRR
jgi:small Trp-rich protein